MKIIEQFNTSLEALIRKGLDASNPNPAVEAFALAGGTMVAQSPVAAEFRREAARAVDPTLSQTLAANAVGVTDHSLYQALKTQNAMFKAPDATGPSQTAENALT